MKKLLLPVVLLLFSFAVNAQDQPKTPPPSQFLFIVRFKSDFVPSSADAVQQNIKHWRAYMGDLGKNGKIAGGYRPGNDGLTITGKDQVVKTGPYIANNDLVSSVLIINAANLDEAKALSLKCPVFEFGGSVEVRSIGNTAN